MEEQILHIYTSLFNFGELNDIVITLGLTG